jgi:hypothetical protein
VTTGRTDRQCAAFTLVEACIAMFLGSMVLGATVYFMRASNMQIVKTSDHAQARMDAIKILNAMGADLDRLVIDDTIRSLVFPVDIKDEGRALEFWALHHREYSQTTAAMALVARKIVYTAEVLPRGGRGVMRNGRRLGGEGVGAIGAVSGLRFETISQKRADALGISPFHAFFAKVYARGAWDVNNAALAGEANVQQRLFHLGHIESQYACMLSVKRAGPPAGVFTGLDQLPEPPALSYVGPAIPMDWVRPLGLVRYDTARPFDDETADVDQPLP